MCLYPKLLLNRKYLPTKKNNFKPPVLTDLRLKYVSVGCGNCIECRKQKSRAWQVRLHEELKAQKYAYFVTLTFSNEELEKLSKETKLKECNAIAGKAVRRFLERYRKTRKKSLRHWFITEMGHKGTERIHLHGIIFRDEELTNEELQKYWKYGITDTGKYCNTQTINYIVKYVTKIDEDHKGYNPQIFCSAGIGNQYIKRGKEYNKFKGTETREYYQLPNGNKINLPIYYRNKLFLESEREQLWLNKINLHERYVMGIKIENIDTPEGEQKYYNILEEQQRINQMCGYGDDSKLWKRKDYNITLRMLNRCARAQENAHARKN